jgi:lipid-binding SYLF domain-containing protein
VAASYGLQAGAQKFGYALFLMNDKAVEYLDNSEGWEIGVGPSIVIVGQKGLMAGLGIQGSKLTKLSK